ncbi:hypothetical protein BMS3Abin06_00987 [bacterium BMS3Abin06]|nr:hypothetical protein BMS3Abin06_00987 [bacterium BMS3Abin06]
MKNGECLNCDLFDFMMDYDYKNQRNQLITKIRVQTIGKVEVNG